jgi:DNA-binding NtrC family response regulator
LSRSRESVLIKGEKGVGKETIARWIHFNSATGKGVFIKIDARALLREDTEWRILEFLRTNDFRKEAGDASSDKTIAGTLYFDEVFDLSNDLQSELLLILEDGTLKTTCNALKAVPEYRIIAGTTQNAEQPVMQGRFRKDLYYRMNVLNLAVPPLRARRQDIPLLTDFFIYKYARECNKSYFKLSREVMDIFHAYDWPRNVDELEAAVKRAVIVHNEKKFLAGFYGNKKQYVRSRSASRNAVSWIDAMLDPKDYLSKVDTMSLKDICWDCLANVEKSLMKKALDQTNWNRKKAADMLAISYKSMLNKIKEYGLA